MRVSAVGRPARACMRSVPSLGDDSPRTQPSALGASGRGALPYPTDEPFERDGGIGRRIGSDAHPLPEGTFPGELVGGAAARLDADEQAVPVAEQREPLGRDVSPYDGPV